MLSKRLRRGEGEFSRLSPFFTEPERYTIPPAAITAVSPITCSRRPVTISCRIIASAQTPYTGSYTHLDVYKRQQFYQGGIQMTDLQECRRQIDEIDSEILRLFEKRMKVSEDVANYKIRTGKPVFDAVREREKLKSLGEQAHGEFNALGIQEVFQQIMAISRKRQYQLLTSNGKEENRYYEMVDTLPPVSYTHLAIKNLS